MLLTHKNENKTAVIFIERGYFFSFLFRIVPLMEFFRVSACSKHQYIFYSTFSLWYNIYCIPRHVYINLASEKSISHCQTIGGRQTDADLKRIKKETNILTECLETMSDFGVFSRETNFYLIYCVK